MGIWGYFNAVHKNKPFLDPLGCVGGGWVVVEKGNQNHSIQAQHFQGKCHFDIGTMNNSINIDIDIDNGKECRRENKVWL